MTSLTLSLQFDPGRWHVVEPPQAPGAGFLFGWTVTPDPVDAGIPQPVARVLAEAAVSIGTVFFGGDADPYGEKGSQQIRFRRHWWRSSELTVYRATSVETVLPAFDSARHDWSMNAQWLVVSDSSGLTPETATVLKTLYANWTLPDPWPAGIRMIIQSAIDGDAAACYVQDPAAQESFIKAVHQSAVTAGMTVLRRHRGRSFTDSQSIKHE